ncbi:hypothetical protein TNCV_4093941 [Trichonephila clavipes]|nr:hypothetical protein TNCV_4093941 [Trichonephila clavipes]
MDPVPKLSAFLEKQAQLCIEDANETRWVTSIRWVVEAVNARLNNIEDESVIAQSMLDLVKKPNYLQQTVEEKDDMDFVK